MRPTLHFAVALGILIAVSAFALAGEAHGVALLVVKGDASAMEETLEANGFATTVREDTGGGDLQLTIEHFLKAAPTHGVALLYIAGRTANRSVVPKRILELIRNECGAAFTLVVLEDPAGHPLPEDSEGENVLLCRSVENLPATITRGPTLRPTARPPSEIAAGDKAGDEWVNALGTVFCWCPPGERGTIERGFWLGKYEVTKREFDLVTKKRPKGALADRPNHPRDGIRYDDILVYVSELNRRERFLGRLPEGWEYTLPTEEQWRYACRAGMRDEAAFHFGDEPERLPEHANFADRSLFDTGEEYNLYADRKLDDKSALLATVGRYKPNPWGLHDMHGNLWEWTATTEEEGGIRYAVARGGSWASLPDYCRTDFRHRFEFTTERNFIGFRLALRRTGANPDR